jgi:hypothetical protein
MGKSSHLDFSIQKYDFKYPIKTIVCGVMIKAIVNKISLPIPKRFADKISRLNEKTFKSYTIYLSFVRFPFAFC